MKKRIIICHDTYSSPRGNWYDWLAQELEMKGFPCTVPELPTPNEQSLQMWKRAMWRDVAKLESDHIVVGHGLGAAFLCNVLQLAFRKITGVFLVGGFCSKIGSASYDLNEGSFVEGPFDWEAIRSYSGQINVYHSDNDSIVPYSFGEELATKLGVKPILVQGVGHFDSQSGVTTFPQLLNDILSLAQKVSPQVSLQMNP